MVVEKEKREREREREREKKTNVKRTLILIGTVDRD